MENKDNYTPKYHKHKRPQAHKTQHAHKNKVAEEDSERKNYINHKTLGSVSREAVRPSMDERVVGLIPSLFSILATWALHAQLSLDNTLTPSLPHSLRHNVLYVICKIYNRKHCLFSSEWEKRWYLTLKLRLKTLKKMSVTPKDLKETVWFIFFFFFLVKPQKMFPSNHQAAKYLV